MLVGVIASNVLRVLDPAESRAVGVLFVGYFFQGVGFFMTMFYICIYILRCVSSVDSDRLRLTIFVSIMTVCTST
jgi:hypothetical protein